MKGNVIREDHRMAQLPQGSPNQSPHLGHVPRNSIEYASAHWENLDDESIPDVSETTLPGKYNSTISNILSRHCSEVRLLSDEHIQTTRHFSKKKLKDLIVKHNNEIFSFMTNPEKIPPVMGAAEMIFRRYGHEVPQAKDGQKSIFLKELNLDASLEKSMQDLNEGLKKLKLEGGVEDFMKEMRWMIHQYKTIGEEVLRLETVLFQKIDLLDKVNHRIPMITSLTNNDALPSLVDAFAKYAEEVYQDSKIETIYKDLIESYKKWNICRQILSFQNMLRCDGAEPMCSICLIENISFTIVPCGHTFCATCAKKQNTTCYICRGSIRERVKLYFT